MHASMHMPSCHVGNGALFMLPCCESEALDHAYDQGSWASRVPQGGSLQGSLDTLEKELAAFEDIVSERA